MDYDIDWICPYLRKPNRLWNIASTLTVSTVGLFCKLFTEWLNTTHVYNKDILTRALARPSHIPLITVSNHHSCFDEPGLWGTLDLKYLFHRDTMRWSLAAHDICFTNVFHSYFFMLGKCIPVIRGKGVYQQALDFCLKQMELGKWIHIFPEGRVNMTKEFIRLKWGVGRLIYDSPIAPIVIPMYHVGMDDVLPNQYPYILRTGKKVTLNYGKPIDFHDMVSDLKKKHASPEEARKTITDKIQDELLMLKSETEQLHIISHRS